jgi:hypothetical protein
MKDVDLLAEIRSWRDEFAKSHGYDLAAIAAAIRKADDAIRERLVRGEPRRPSATSTPIFVSPRPRPTKAASDT